MSRLVVASAASRGRLRRRIAHVRRAGKGRELAVGIALVVLGLGAATALSGGDDAPVAISSGPLTLELPSGWERSAAAKVPGIQLADAVAAASPARGGVALVAGFADGAADLRTIVRRVPSEQRGRRTVRLGEIEAWRWSDVPIGRAQVADVFLAHTSRGPLVAVCRAPAGPGGALAGCARVVRTLRVSDARPVALGSVARVRDELGGALSELRREHVTHREALARATVAERQVEAARSLQASFSRASETIAAIPTRAGAPDLSKLTDTLEEAADAYGGLAQAIVSGDSVGFDAARVEIQQQEARFERAVAAAAIP